MRKRYSADIQNIKERYDVEISDLKREHNEISAKYEKMLTETKANLDMEKENFASEIIKIKKSLTEKNEERTAIAVGKKCEEVKNSFTEIIEKQEDEFKKKIGEAIKAEREKYTKMVDEMKTKFLSQKDREIDELKNILTGERNTQESMKDDMAQSQVKISEAAS